jgi:hypothetical protein
VIDISRAICRTRDAVRAAGSYSPYFRPARVLAIGPDALTIWKSLTADASSHTPTQSPARTGIHPVSGSCGCSEPGNFRDVPGNLPWARGRRCLCRTGLFALESRGTALPNRARSVVGEHPGGLSDTGTDAGSVLNAELAGGAPPQTDGIVR